MLTGGYKWVGRRGRSHLKRGACGVISGLEGVVGRT